MVNSLGQYNLVNPVSSPEDTTKERQECFDVLPYGLHFKALEKYLYEYIPLPTDKIEPPQFHRTSSRFGHLLVDNGMFSNSDKVRKINKFFSGDKLFSEDEMRYMHAKLDELFLPPESLSAEQIQVLSAQDLESMRVQLCHKPQIAWAIQNIVKWLQDFPGQLNKNKYSTLILITDYVFSRTLRELYHVVQIFKNPMLLPPQQRDQLLIGKSLKTLHQFSIILEKIILLSEYWRPIAADWILKNDKITDLIGRYYQDQYPKIVEKFVSDFDSKDKDV